MTQRPASQWFDNAGFGVFIHWGFISQRGYELSWPLLGRPVRPRADQPPRTVSVAEYFDSVDSFNPTAWNANELVAHLKRAGATYAVFPARHHDGYTMYHSNVSDFGIHTSSFGRDVLAEFVAAAREAGLRVGVYYSLPDWHHPDYPAFTDEDRPYPDEHWPRAGLPGTTTFRRHRRSDPQAWKRYQQYLRDQLSEILTRYGQIDLLWFDGEWERTPQEWDAAGLRQLIKTRQPDILINSRLPENGDYDTPEQGMPLDPPEGHWELCMTIGDQWGYRPDEPNIKTPRQIIGRLAQAASLGGNLLLNVSPDSTGTLPTYQVETLQQIGEWLAHHAPAIIAARPATDIQHYGPVTRSETAIYAHLLHPPIDTFEIAGVPADRIQAVRRMADAEPLEHQVRGEIHVQKSLKERRGRIVLPPVTPSTALLDTIEIILAPKTRSGIANNPRNA